VAASAIEMLMHSIDAKTKTLAQTDVKLDWNNLIFGHSP
jgi:hypothetical protein